MKKYPINKDIIHLKIKAALLHFICSLAIFLISFTWIRLVLYPEFHFDLNGVIYGLRIVAGVDLILGPLLTILVYHSMKPMKEKILDFSIIGAVQVAALVYGLWTMYLEHPRTLSFLDYGSITTVTQREFNERHIHYPENIQEFKKIAGVPVAILAQDSDNQGYIFQKITLSDLQKADASTRATMSYQEDKDTLATLEQQHGKLYVFGLMGKYQGIYVGLNEQMDLVATFGQKDLH